MALLPQNLCFTCRRDFELDQLIYAWQTTSEGKIGISIQKYDAAVVEGSCALCILIYNAASSQGQDAIRRRAGIRLYCDPVWDSADGSPPDEQQLHQVRVQTSSGSDLDVLLRLQAAEGSYASQFLTGRWIGERQLPEVFSKIKSWRQECQRHHLKCQKGLSGKTEDEAVPLPKRVIQIYQDGARLFDGQGEFGVYATLSYCWGSAKTSHVTTKENCISRYKSIKMAELSKTCSDAIEIARGLDIEFIWIDSICIVQDDAHDKAEELPKMGDIYTRSSLTLAATAAGSSDAGFFSTRPSHETLAIPSSFDTPSNGCYYLTTASWTGGNQVDQAPLNRRAWVLQERILSRRIVHFASSQVYWTCRESAWNEESCLAGADMNDMSDYYQLTTVMEDLDKEVYNFYTLWTATVTSYSGMSISYSTDRIPALQGVTTLIHKRRNWPYHYGHWDDGTGYFMASLLWMRSSDDSKYRSQQARAPSWSWLSIDGRVGYIEFTIARKSDWETMPQREVTPASWSVSGSKGLQLQLLGLLGKAAGYHEVQERVHFSLSHYNEDHYHSFYRFYDEQQATELGIVRFDLPGMKPETFFFCPLWIFRFLKSASYGTRPWKGESAFYAIAFIALMEAGEDHYRRVGMGFLNLYEDPDSGKAGMDALEGLAQQHITII